MGAKRGFANQAEQPEYAGDPFDADTAPDADVAPEPDSPAEDDNALGPRGMH